MKKLQTTITNNQLIHGQYGDITFGPWGLECSDRYAFVTITDTPRNTYQSGDVWHLSSGRIQIEYTTRQKTPDKVSLNLRIRALDDVLLQDAVIRLVFDKKAITHGIIAGNTVTHHNSDKYRLFPTRQTKLIGQDGATISVSLENADGAGRFAPYLYLRDRDDHWIIHARLLPTDPVDHVWLRWANRLFTLSAPNGVSLSLWRIKPFKAIFWRLRERMGRHFPEIQAVPLNRLNAGQSVSMEVTCHFH